MGNDGCSLFGEDAEFEDYPAAGLGTDLGPASDADFAGKDVTVGGGRGVTSG